MSKILDRSVDQIITSMRGWIAARKLPRNDQFSVDLERLCKAAETNPRVVEFVLHEGRDEAKNAQLHAFLNGFSWDAAEGLNISLYPNEGDTLVNVTLPDGTVCIGVRKAKDAQS